MRQSALVGAALIFLSAAPTFAEYIPFARVSTNLGSGPMSGAVLMVDGVETSSGVVYWAAFGNAVVENYLNTPLSVGAVKLCYTCNDGKPKSWRIFNSAGTLAEYNDSMPVSLGGGCFYWGLQTPIVPRYSGGPAFTFGPVNYTGLNSDHICEIFEMQVLSPTDAQSVVITSDVIAGLLSNATFQTVISSIAAASDIADWLTFAPNETGGKAAWIFGCFLAVVFIIGIRTGAST